MKERKVVIGSSCAFVETTYGEGIKDVDLQYTEHSTDHWNSDSETCLTITKEKAAEIIEFLRGAFGI